MLKSRTLLFLGIMLVLLFSIPAITFAYFSSVASSSGNDLSAGTMYIGGENGSRGVLDNMTSMGELFPGGEPQKIKFKIKNLGNMTTYIKGISVTIPETEDKLLANALKTQVSSMDGNLLFQGSLLALDGNIVPLERSLEIKVDETIELEITMQLDFRVGSWYKGKKIEMTVSTYAYQKPDQSVSRVSILTNQNDLQGMLENAKTGDVILLSGGIYGEIKLNVPGVILKAKDVIFDTVLGGVSVSIGKNEVQNMEPVKLQGFTINDLNNKFGVEIKKGSKCDIEDNIINSKGYAVIINGFGTVKLNRNDLTGSYYPYINGEAGIINSWCNLGDDIKPE